MLVAEEMKLPHSEDAGEAMESLSLAIIWHRIQSWIKGASTRHLGKTPATRATADRCWPRTNNLAGDTSGRRVGATA